MLAAEPLSRARDAELLIRGERGVRHLCAFHECTLRESVRAMLLAELQKAQPVLDLSSLLQLPHTAPPPYVDLTPRRLSVHLEGSAARRFVAMTCAGTEML